jgi:hypothetical protein
MALLNRGMPDLPTANLLKEAGILKTQENPESLEELLKSNNLSKNDLLEAISFLANNGQTDAVRLRAVELGLKLQGLLAADNQVAATSFTIVIRDANPTPTINPILLPRPQIVIESTDKENS